MCDLKFHCHYLRCHLGSAAASGKTVTVRVVALTFTLLLPTLAVGQDAGAGQALSAIFDVQRAPTAKSMGLLQGNFLDAVRTDGSLQLALVVDSTESMTDQLTSIRANLPNLIDDLSRLMDGGLETAIVTFADIDEKPTPVTALSQGFVGDPAVAMRLIEGLQPSSGRPYFPESVDLGVHHAISGLPWSTEKQVEKWILLIGDAPPYDPSFDDPDTAAQRWYETELLIDLANQQGIKIHCLLCNSRAAERDAYDALLGKTRQFMGRLSTETGGLMLDMSYQQVREELASSASRIRPEYVRIGHITEHDVEQVRAAATPADDSEVSVRVAVLPFVPLQSMTFYYERPEVQLATEVRQLLKSLPFTRVVSPRQLDQELTRLKSEGIPEADWAQAICFRLRADFLLTGQMRMSQGQASAQVQLVGRDSKEPLARVDVSSARAELAQQMLGQLSASRSADAKLAHLINRMRDYASAEQVNSSEIGFLSQLDFAEKAVLLSGLEALEQAIGYSLGDPSGKSLLDAAAENLQAFVRSHPQEPFPFVLLASVKFNQAKVFETLGQNDEAEQRASESSEAIKQAFLLRDQLLDRLTRLEVEADYHLLVRKEYQTSVDRYQEIIGHSESSPLNRSLRAHWMLAGIHSGDWGVARHDPSAVDLPRARDHLIQILAFWPESPEAQTIKQHLLWDGKNNRSRHPYIPRTADLVLTSH